MDELKLLKNRIIETVYNAKEGHIASALSILDIVYVLYDKILNTDLSDPNRDRFVLSKGHGCLALYTVLEHKGLIPKYELDNYCKFDANLGGHPFPKLPHIESATGSLGHGISFAVGLALGMKLKESKGRVFVLVGDQECNEGTIWESALLINRHNLSNLRLIIDNNNSSNRSLFMYQMLEKFQSFGLNSTCINGHDHTSIIDAINKEPPPKAIIAHTLKGYRCKLIEENPNEWHHKIPTEEEYKQFLNE
jgi:transketolase